MSHIFSSLRQAARSLGLITVGILSTLGALSLTHIGPVEAQASGDSLASLTARLNADEATIAELKAKTAPLSVSGTELTLAGVNVHIVSGSGSTSDGTANQYGEPISGKSLSGLGNLIIGYNATGYHLGSGDARTGSHNLILGDKNNYSSFGGLIAGQENTISGFYASVSGGQGNTPSGRFASVSGGQTNIVRGSYASVSGGANGTARGQYSSVNGGEHNTASVRSW